MDLTHIQTTLSGSRVGHLFMNSYPTLDLDTAENYIFERKYWHRRRGHSWRMCIRTASFCNRQMMNPQMMNPWNPWNRGKALFLEMRKYLDIKMQWNIFSLVLFEPSFEIVWTFLVSGSTFKLIRSKSRVAGAGHFLLLRVRANFASGSGSQLIHVIFLFFISIFNNYAFNKEIKNADLSSALSLLLTCPLLCPCCSPVFCSVLTAHLSALMS